MKLANLTNKLVTVNVPGVGFISVSANGLADFPDEEAWRGKANGLVEAVEKKPEKVVMPEAPKIQKKMTKKGKYVDSWD